MAFPTLPAPLAQALAERDYADATPVQAQVLEPEAAGRDLIVSAQTGSGKTVAFGLAMAAQLLDSDGKAPWPGAPLGLVIAPTRELALQVARELEWLTAKTGARIISCVGGMDAMKERRALAQGATIVVGTPGRLRDHLERGALDLSHLAVVVLDEADEMLDMGFREELEEILDATPAERRTLLFSATMPRPIVALAKRYQRDALRISTVGEDRGHGDIAYQAMAVAPADIEHAVINMLRLHEAETALLFCATRDNVRHLPTASTSAASRWSLCRASIARPSATTRCRRCATGACGSASRPTSPRAASTCPACRWSSMSRFRATPRRCSTARAAPAAPARRAPRS